ncbi:PC-esterase domain-containing protein 1A isoform X3 [Pogona vitticeps]
MRCTALLLQLVDGLRCPTRYAGVAGDPFFVSHPCRTSVTLERQRFHPALWWRKDLFLERLKGGMWDKRGMCVSQSAAHSPALLSLDLSLSPQGELRFQNDHLIEGGVEGGLHNETHYREVRQYRTDHHLVRFYFLTRVYSPYLESILDDFRAGLQPDVLILNSCVWDVSRYGSASMKQYQANLETAFDRLEAVLPSSCLVIWNMTMPLGRKIRGGFLIPELQHLSKTLRKDVIEGNFYGAMLAGSHLFDVVDLHYHFRHDLGHRVKDGIHWNNLVHRRITNLLLAHVADAWGVVMLEKKPRAGTACHTSSDEHPYKSQGEPKAGRLAPGLACKDEPLDFHPAVTPLLSPVRRRRPPSPSDLRRTYPDFSSFQDDGFFLPGHEGSPEPFAGFTSFEDNDLPPFHLDAAACNNFRRFEEADRTRFSVYPSHNVVNSPPRSRNDRRKVRRVTEHRHGLVMRRRSFHARDTSPYRRTHVRYRCY